MHHSSTYVSPDSPVDVFDCPENSEDSEYVRMLSQMSTICRIKLYSVCVISLRIQILDVFQTSPKIQEL